MSRLGAANLLGLGSGRESPSVFSFAVSEIYSLGTKIAEDHLMPSLKVQYNARRGVIRLVVRPSPAAQILARKQEFPVLHFGTVHDR